MTKLRFSRFALRSIALALGAAATFSCSEPTAPTPREAQPSALLGLPITIGIGGVRIVDTTVTTLRWATPLLEDVTTSATIGPEGGTITIPQTGFRLDVPAYAVTSPTTITVTAVAGSTVAYEFQPAGATFAKRLTVRQDLSLTTILPTLLETDFTGAYFSSRDDILPDGSALVHELEPTTVDLFSLKVRFTVSHFSGYLVGVD